MRSLTFVILLEPHLDQHHSLPAFLNCQHGPNIYSHLFPVYSPFVSLWFLNYGREREVFMNFLVHFNILERRVSVQWALSGPSTLLLWFKSALSLQIMWLGNMNERSPRAKYQRLFLLFDFICCVFVPFKAARQRNTKQRWGIVKQRRLKRFAAGDGKLKRDDWHWVFSWILRHRARRRNYLALRNNYSTSKNFFSSKFASAWRSLCSELSTPGKEMKVFKTELNHYKENKRL